MHFTFWIYKYMSSMYASIYTYVSIYIVYGAFQCFPQVDSFGGQMGCGWGGGVDAANPVNHNITEHVDLYKQTVKRIHFGQSTPFLTYPEFHTAS